MNRLPTIIFLAAATTAMCPLSLHDALPLIFLANLLLIPLAYLAAFAIRFDFHIPAWEWDRYVATVPYLVIVRLIVFERYGLFRGYWRHVGMRDLVDLGAATTLSTCLFAGVLLLVGWPTGMPRSVLDRKSTRLNSSHTVIS